MGKTKTQLHRDITFQQGGNKQVTVTVINILVYASQNNADVIITLSCKPTSYAEIDTNELFGLQIENRLGALDHEFDKEKNIEIEIRLKEENVDIVIDKCKDAEGIKKAIILSDNEPVSNILKSCESWLALNVKQNIDLPSHLHGKGLLKTGYYTVHREEKRETNTLMTELLLTFFEKNSIKFLKQNDRNEYQIRIVYAESAWNCFIYLIESTNQIMVANIYPEIIPVNKRSLIGEYITRANDGLVSGNFALNLDEGDLYFKITEHLNSTESFDVQLSSMIQVSVETFEKYIPGIISILSGRIEISQLILEIET
jgi:hypothetical protein